ncbi:MAG: hypothetical protein ABFD57_06255 [Smithella sp.]|nr:hypothetical protein [Syntrophaceae bacterium]NTW77932.1 hypothetical protein [Syntrophaceae bacterium]
MNETFYKIRKAFLIPLFFIMVLLFLLFVISLINGQRWEIIVAAVLFLASLFACMDLVKRKIVINDQGLKIKNIFRSKEFGWMEITHLAVVVLKKKVYFLLTTTKGFYIFSNLFENHALLVGSLMDRLDEEKVEVEVKRYLEQPLERLSLIVMSWVAVGIIIGVIVIKISEIYI